MWASGFRPCGSNAIGEKPPNVQEMKLKELKNGRLAMLAFGGAITQAACPIFYFQCGPTPKPQNSQNLKPSKPHTPNPTLEIHSKPPSPQHISSRPPKTLSHQLLNKPQAVGGFSGFRGSGIGFRVGFGVSGLFINTGSRISALGYRRMIIQKGSDGGRTFGTQNLAKLESSKGFRRPTPCKATLTGNGFPWLYAQKDRHE